MTLGKIANNGKAASRRLMLGWVEPRRPCLYGLSARDWWEHEDRDGLPTLAEDAQKSENTAHTAEADHVLEILQCLHSRRNQPGRLPGSRRKHPASPCRRVHRQSQRRQAMVQGLRDRPSVFDAVAAVGCQFGPVFPHAPAAGKALHDRLPRFSRLRTIRTTQPCHGIYLGQSRGRSGGPSASSQTGQGLAHGPFGRRCERADIPSASTDWC